MDLVTLLLFMQVRWQMITDMAVRPRQSEKDYIAMAVPKDDGKAYIFEGRTYTAGEFSTYTPVLFLLNSERSILPELRVLDWLLLPKEARRAD